MDIDGSGAGNAAVKVDYAGLEKKNRKVITSDKHFFGVEPLTGIFQDGSAAREVDFQEEIKRLTSEIEQAAPNMKAIDK
jgi:hypothetical protein